ncbi:MAG: ATP-binding protein [Anaerolineae bacterium]
MSWIRSLGARLVVAFVVVSLLGTLLVAAYVAYATRDRFTDYQEEQTATTMATIYAERYVAGGGWEAIIVGRIPVPYGESGGPATVADLEGRAVVASPGIRVGDRIPQDKLERGIPIKVDGEIVGTLVPLWDERPPLPQNPFLLGFYRALAIGGGGATLLALLLAVLFSRSLRRPLRELADATRAVAQGELGLQIPVRSRDELGTLAGDFNRMSADLAGAERQRRQMTADIAHELRTPLSLIIGHAEAIEDGVLPATPETVGIIHDEARSLARLVDDLRTLSLADAHQLTMAIQPVSPVDLLQRAGNTYRPRAAEHGITLTVEVPDNLPSVAADSGRVAQVLGNLLSNALRHTPQGGTITLRAVEDGALVRFGVSDTGPGIAPDDLPHIFDRFYRGDSSRHRESGGSGLGLGIARSLVEAQGGRIWAESPPGSGATFWFTLPSTTPSRPGV